MRWDFKHRTANAFESRIGEARAGRLGAAQRVVPICRRQGQGLCQVQAGREGDARRGGQVGGVHAGPDKGPCRGRGGDAVRKGGARDGEVRALGGSRRWGRAHAGEAGWSQAGQIWCGGATAGVDGPGSSAGPGPGPGRTAARTVRQAKQVRLLLRHRGGKESPSADSEGGVTARSRVIMGPLPHNHHNPFCFSTCCDLSGAGGEERRSAPLGQARGRLGRAEAPPAAPAPMHWTWHA